MTTTAAATITDTQIETLSAEMDQLNCPPAAPAQGALILAVGTACGAVASGSDEVCEVYVHRSDLSKAHAAIRAVGWNLHVDYNPHDHRNNIGDSVRVTVTRRDPEPWW